MNEENNSVVDDMVFILKRQSPEYINTFVNDCLDRCDCSNCPDAVYVLCQELNKEGIDPLPSCGNIWRQAAKWIKDKPKKDEDYEK